MKRLIVIFATVLSLAGAGLAQESERPARLSSVAMAKIVGIVLRAEFTPADEEKVVYLHGHGVKETWLPKITNTNFIIIDDAELRKLDKAHLLKEPVLAQGKVRVDFGYGNGCSATGASYFFRVRGNRVTRAPINGGWGSACGHGQGTAH
jgi:hypothetical protein